jgi:hypothetical protein
MAAQPYPKTFVIPNRFSGEESAGPCEQQVPRCFRFAQRLGMTNIGADLEAKTFT